MNEEIQVGDLVDIKVKSLDLGIGLVIKCLPEAFSDQGSLFNGYVVLTQRGTNCYFSFELSKIND